MKKLILSLFLSLFCVAYSFAYVVDGIDYYLDEILKTAKVGMNTSKSGSVTIPSTIAISGTEYSVTSIGGGAFDGCSKLTSVTIPNSVTSIGDYAFRFCYGLTSVTIPNSVTSIGDCAFLGCSSLTSVTIPNSVTNIGESAFYGCSKLTSVTIPNSVTSIEYSTFEGCSGLTSVSIPNSVTSIGRSAFEDCSKLTSVTIPNSVTSIEDRAFYGCSGLTSVTIPNSVTSIKQRVFMDCSSLRSVTIPNSVTSIGIYAFARCSSLTSVTIPNNSVTSIGECAFEGCTSLTSVTIPNSVTSIGNQAFSNCSKLTSVTIPNSVTSIGRFAFSGCSSLTSVNISSLEAWCKIEFLSTTSNPLYYLNTNDKNLYLNGEKITDLLIPNSVTSIGDYTFCRCKSLTSVTIPHSVTSIGASAFGGCSGFTSVTIPNSVTNIGASAFSGCSGLTSVTIPNSVTSIGASAFGSCSGLTSVTIPNSVTSIEEKTFYQCTSLTSVTIPNSVTRIGDFAFQDCNNIETVTCLVTSVPSTSSTAFYRLTYDNITLTIPEASLQAYKTTYPWSEFGTFKTIKKDETINDNCSTYSHEVEEESKNISYTRNFSNTSWQALYVPFSMSYDDWKDDFEVAYINNVNQYDDDEDGTIDRTVMEVIKMKEGKSIEPNTPYLIKAKTTGEKTITLEDATLYKTEETTYSVTSWFNSFNFVGTYHTISDMATKGYYAMAGGALKQATSDAVTLQPFRWYLSVTDRNGNHVSLNAKSMSIVFDDGEATGIETISNEKSNSLIHTLTGISKGNDVKALAPGIYIKNGKKFIVK